jgi:hypothetical protein
LALWDVHGFWRDVILFQFRQPFRKDALSIANLLVPIPFLATLGFVGMGTIHAKRWSRPHPSMFAASFGFVLLIFVCTNKQAFCNYYFLILHSLMLSAATMGICGTRGPSSEQGFQEFDAPELRAAGVGG